MNLWKIDNFMYFCLKFQYFDFGYLCEIVNLQNFW